MTPNGRVQPIFLKFWLYTAVEKKGLEKKVVIFVHFCRNCTQLFFVAWKHEHHNYSNHGVFSKFKLKNTKTYKVFLKTDWNSEILCPINQVHLQNACSSAKLAIFYMVTHNKMCWGLAGWKPKNSPNLAVYGRETTKWSVTYILYWGYPSEVRAP